eukprot:ctg_528.g251
MRREQELKTPWDEQVMVCCGWARLTGADAAGGVPVASVCQDVAIWASATPDAPRSVSPATARMAPQVALSQAPASTYFLAQHGSGGLRGRQCALLAPALSTLLPPPCRVCVVPAAASAPCAAASWPLSGQSLPRVVVASPRWPGAPASTARALSPCADRASASPQSSRPAGRAVCRGAHTTRSRCGRHQMPAVESAALPRNRWPAAAPRRPALAPSDTPGTTPESAPPPPPDSPDETPPPRPVCAARPPGRQCARAPSCPATPPTPSLPIPAPPRPPPPTPHWIDPT